VKRLGKLELKVMDYLNQRRGYVYVSEIIGSLFGDTPTKANRASVSNSLKRLAGKELIIRPEPGLVRWINAELMQEIETNAFTTSMHYKEKPTGLTCPCCGRRISEDKAGV
jgi:predicted transcriptional regulator